MAPRNSDSVSGADRPMTNEFQIAYSSVRPPNLHFAIFIFQFAIVFPSQALAHCIMLPSLVYTLAAQERLMTDRVALYLQDKHPLQEAIAHVRYAESRGFEAVWQAESRLVRDAI